ncbi:MAG: hypothetical protein AABY22_09995 [Nanoarchaeota archaeon]
MKKIYEFKVDKEIEKDEETKTKNEAGEEVVTKIKKKVKEPQSFFLRKPNRKLFDDAEFFYGIQVSNCIKAGLLTRLQLSSKFTDEQKTFSEIERKKYIDDNIRIFEIDKEYRKLLEIEENKRSEEQKIRIKELKDEILLLRDEIQQFELTQNSLFDYTAETRARNKTVLWWVFNLAYKNGDKEEPFFGEGSYEEKEKVLDNAEDKEDLFVLKVIEKFLYSVNIWYMGRASKQEEFDELMARLETKEKEEPKKDDKEEKPKEKKPKEEKK